MSPSEERIQAAIQVYQSGQFKSLTTAAKRFNYIPSIVMRRALEVIPRVNSILYNRKLSKTEEQILIK